MNNIALAFGGNIGNPPELFIKAIENLINNSFKINKISPVFKTPPVACEENANDFYNCVITGQWQESPGKLLSLCQKIELQLGRPKKHSSQESRLIDIDIILFGEKTVASDKLILPHPRAHERLFVLIPLNEIASDWIFPQFKLNTYTLLKRLRDKEKLLYEKIYKTKFTLLKS